MRFNTEADIQALIDHRIPESAGLEYKRQLDFGSKSQKGEVLKDLTGMANGGGGTILYGVDEEEKEDSNVAKEITPLTDRGPASALEDLVRSGVQPPLLVEYKSIEVEGGFVLAVDVRPSPLGPYMVTAFKKHSYFHRSGTSTSPMNESQVRDAYALALRARDTRAQDWEDRHLPLRPRRGAWVVVSAVPEVLRGDVIDMLTAEPEDFRPPVEFSTYVNNWHVGDLTPALDRLIRWEGGFHGEASQQQGLDRVIRLDRDGALAVGFQFSDRADDMVWTSILFRLLNTALLYSGWIWTSQGLRSSVELTIELVNGLRLRYSGACADDAFPDGRALLDPAGIADSTVQVGEVALPHTLRRASVRHGLLMRFADRLHQGLGERRAEAPFRQGTLYDGSGNYLNMSMSHDSIRNDGDRSGGYRGTVHLDGEVSGREGEVVAWARDGVVLDLDGNALAVLEMAPGIGCPDDFVGQTLSVHVDGAATQYAGRPSPWTGPSASPPSPTGRWSGLELRTLLG